MTFITVDKGLTKENGIKAAIKKIEENPANKPFRYTGAFYSQHTGQVAFVEVPNAGFKPQKKGQNCGMEKFQTLKNQFRS